MTHRTFIAVFPPEEIIQQILSIQNKLSSFAGNVRWEKKEKFHFTLQFWGDQTEDWIENIADEIRKLCSSISPFQIKITTLGCFPNRYSPKIFWVGSAKEENANLIELSNKITGITKHNGIEPDKKPFHPHITISRGKGKISSELIHKVQTLNFPPIEFFCTEVKIMRSQLASSGSTYTTLFTIPL